MKTKMIFSKRAMSHQEEKKLLKKDILKKKQ